MFCAHLALSKLRLLLFEARLSGYCVREGRQGSQPGFLVLAFSARTLKSSGVPGKTSAGRGLLRGHVAFGL